MITVHVPEQGVLKGRMSPDEFGTTLNAGLLYDRYVGLPPERARGRDAKEGSDTEKAAKAYLTIFQAQGEEGRAALKQARERLDALGGHRFPADKHEGPAPERWDHWYLDMMLETRLAIGLGNVHPFENGLSFHHTLGVPFIPGTSLKGAARAFAAFDESAETLDTWYGRGPSEQPSTESEPQNDHAGMLVFMDALPSTWPTMKLDIINCHLPAYYRGTANPGAVPKESPVPALFLTLAPGTKFRFRVGARRRAPEGAEAAWEALKLLKEALELTGIGAKTGAGYGYFGEPREGKRKK